MKELLPNFKKVITRVILDFIAVVIFIVSIGVLISSIMSPSLGYFFIAILLLLCSVLTIPESFPVVKNLIKFREINETQFYSAIVLSLLLIFLTSLLIGVVSRKQDEFNAVRASLMQDMMVATDDDKIQRALNNAKEKIDDADDDFKNLYELTTQRLETLRAENVKRDIADRKAKFDNQKEKILSSIKEKIDTKDYSGAKQIIAEFETIQDADVNNLIDQINTTEAEEKQKIEEKAEEQRQANARIQEKAALAARLAWDIDSEKIFTKKEKAIVKAGALKVLKDNPNCQSIFTGYRSGQKKGSYYVSCEAANGGMPFNVWFSPSDVIQDKNITVPKPLEESAARKLCYDAIMANTIHPSTLDIHSIMGYSTSVGNNGNREILQTFSAKNSLGLELQHKARCLIMPDGKVELNVSEKR